MKQSNSINNPDLEVLEDEGTDISEYIGLLMDNRWLIGGVTALFAFVALVYAVFSTPIYRADALVQIEQGKGKFGGGDELAVMMGREDFSSSLTEIEILKSRSVIGDVVEKEQLTISVQPKRFPLIGAYIARKNSAATEPVSSWLGFSSYAWGGERLTVSRFDVGRNFVGAGFTLVAGEQGNFSLRSAAGEDILQGKVGEATTSKDGSIQLFVSELVALDGTSFLVSKNDHYAVIESLQSRIKIVENGRGTGLLTLSLDGADRERIRTIIHGLTQSYLRQNVERRSEESEMMLQFINTQMPVMRTELNAAEQALNLYREKANTIDLSVESQNLIQRITAVETAISSLGFERAELMQKLTEKHPVVQGIDEKMRRLQGQMEKLEAELKTVPEKELESVKLSRDVKVASELYMLLLNKSQELKVVKAGTLGNVRIVDEALAGVQAVKPKKGRIVIISILLGMMFGVVLVFLRKALNKTIHDPAIVEKQLGHPIYAEIPFSKYQEEMIKLGKKRLDKSGYELLAKTKGDNQVLESFRSLRTSIQFALMESENNIVMMSGPSPEIGKTFISANFAYVMAESGKKILLIDADMRKGHLNYYFNLKKSPGLSELLSGEQEFDVVRHQGILNENIDVITSGIYPPNPSELLMSDAFKSLLEKIKDSYDLVIIDTPPILAVTDASIIGQYASTNFLVLRSGRHNIREVEAAFKRFEQNGVHLKGTIFNGIELMKGGYGNKYGYKYYGYQYDYK